MANHQQQQQAPLYSFNNQQQAPLYSFNNQQQQAPLHSFNNQQQAPPYSFNNQQQAPPYSFNNQQQAPLYSYNQLQQQAPLNFNTNQQQQAPLNFIYNQQQAPLNFNYNQQQQQAPLNFNYNQQQQAPLNYNYNQQQAPLYFNYQHQQAPLNLNYNQQQQQASANFNYNQQQQQAQANFNYDQQQQQAPANFNYDQLQQQQEYINQSQLAESPNQKSLTASTITTELKEPLLTSTAAVSKKRFLENDEEEIVNELKANAEQSTLIILTPAQSEFNTSVFDEDDESNEPQETTPQPPIIEKNKPAKQIKLDEVANAHAKLIFNEDVSEISYENYDQFEKEIASEKNLNQGFLKFRIIEENYSNLVINQNLKISYNEQTYSKKNHAIVLTNVEHYDDINLGCWIENNKETIDPLNHEAFYNGLNANPDLIKTDYSLDNEHHMYDLKSKFNFNNFNSPLTLAGLINRGM
jgi:hypothetical protein